MIGSYMATLLLQTPAGAGVKSHYDQDGDAQGEVDKIKHVWLRVENRCNMRLRAVSGPYGKWGFSIKEI